MRPSDELLNEFLDSLRSVAVFRRKHEMLCAARLSWEHLTNTGNMACTCSHITKAMSDMLREYSNITRVASYHEATNEQLREWIADVDKEVCAIRLRVADKEGRAS